MKHEVIHLADFLWSERGLYLKKECDYDLLSDAIERYKQAIHKNIERLGSPTFHGLRRGILTLREYYTHRRFLPKPMSWTLEEFRNILLKCDFFECQILLFEIEQSLKHDNIKYLESAKNLFEAYRNLVRARKNELRYEVFL